MLHWWRSGASKKRREEAAQKGSRARTERPEEYQDEERRPESVGCLLACRPVGFLEAAPIQKKKPQESSEEEAAEKHPWTKQRRAAQAVSGSRTAVRIEEASYRRS